MIEGRSKAFWFLAIFFGLYVLFLYGPMIAIYILSFQGPQGGLTFPMNGVSLTWFAKLWQGNGIIDIGASFTRSLGLGVTVMVLTVVISVSAGMAFRRRFAGQALLFYVAIASLIVPSLITSLGIALEFRLLDDYIINHFGDWGMQDIADNWQTAMGLYTSGLGAHLTWTLPFGLLIMFAVFNRFNPAYEEAARDLGASPWQTFAHVVLPIILPSLIGVGLFGFTLSYDEFARTLMTSGSFNTLPLEIYGMTTNVTTPVLYALGTVTTVFSLAVILLALATIAVLRKRRARRLAG